MGIFLSVIVVVLFILLFYIFSRTFRQMGYKGEDKELSDKKFYQHYFGIQWNYTRKHWIFESIFILTILITVLLSIRFKSRIPFDLCLLLFGIFVFVANIKNHPIIADLLPFFSTRSRKILFYIISLVVIITSTLQIFLAPK